MFDITTLAPTETSFMQLKNPATQEMIFTGEDDGIRAVGITFHSPGSAVYEAAGAARVNRQMLRNKKKPDITAEALAAEQAEFLAAVTASFDHLSYPPAQGASGTALYKALYSDPKYGWILGQANAFMGDWENFIGNSATS